MTHLGPQFEQLAMFHQAKDFVGDQKTTASTKIYPGAADYYQGGASVMWEAKRRESNEPRPDRHFTAPVGKETLKESIAREGVRAPARVVHLPDDERGSLGGDERRPGQPYLFDAHHRVLAVHDLHGPHAEIPVLHADLHNSPYEAEGMERADVTPNPKMVQGFVPPKKRR